MGPERHRCHRPALRLLRQPLQASPVGARRGHAQRVQIHLEPEPTVGTLVQQAYAEGRLDGRRGR